MLARERRALTLSFLFGLFLIFTGATDYDVGTPIFLSICGVLILGGFFIGNNAENRSALRTQRLEAMKSNRKVGLLNNILVMFIPILVGLLTYFVFDFEGINAFHLTIGFFCVGSFIAHFITAPHMAKLDLETFD